MIEDINSYLVGDTLTHDEVADRIYWLDAPQQPTKPYMTYFETADPHLPMSFDQTDAGQSVTRVNIYSSNRFTALSAANVIRGRLERYEGAMNNSTIEYIRCSGTRLTKVPEHDFYQGTFDMAVNYYD